MNLIFTLLVSLAWMTAEAYERTPLGDSIDRATLKVLKEAFEESSDKNVITSPLGVFLLLSLYSEGSGPLGRQEIDSLLGGGDHKQLTESYSGLSNEFSKMDPSYLTLANKIYVSDKCELNPKFADAARNYGNDVDKVDFTDAKKAADIINSWAAEKSHGRITAPVAASDIDNDTVVALLNTIFFEGEWAVPFDKSKTKNRNFYTDKDTVVKKATMTLTDWIPYVKSEELGASLTELRYREDGFRLILVVPNEVDGLPAVLEKATQRGLLEDISRLNTTSLHLTFPKFEIRSKLDFNEILPKVGISKIFEEKTTGIVDVPSVVYKVFQEAVVKFDEKGAIATAVSGMFILTRSFIPKIEPEVELRVDHPFLFYILHEDKVLFAGTYSV